jgi:hypothetical protein
LELLQKELALLVYLYRGGLPSLDASYGNQDRRKAHDHQDKNGKENEEFDKGVSASFYVSHCLMQFV